MDDEAQETPNVGALPRKAPKVSVFREQILQLAGIACHEEEGKSRTELLEKLKTCNKVMLVELCRSFDVPGSTSTKKVGPEFSFICCAQFHMKTLCFSVLQDELVTILMEFLMEHCSGIIYTDPDKAQLLSGQKLKKRKRNKNGANLSGGEPSKKRKPDGTLLEFCSQEEADGRKAVEDRTNHSEFCLRDSRDELVNDSALGKLAVVPLPGVLIPTDEQTLITTPSAKLFSNVENDTTDMAASMKKNISVTKKKAIQNTDSKEKSGGKIMSRGDAKPWKQAPKPSKDELRQAVFCILGAANFATMTFGEVVKAVDKYFGKDLFERKPLVRALIEEELFRLAKEAERKEVEEEEAMEAKVRAEQAAKDSSARDGRVESEIDKEYEVEGGPDGKSKDAEKTGNSNGSEEGGKSGICVKAGEKAAENLQDGKAEVDTRKKEFSEDCEAEKIVQNANGDGGTEILRDGKAETVNNNCNGNTIGGSEDVKSGEKDGRSEEGRAENAGDCEAEESETCPEAEAEVEDVKSKEASGNEISLNPN
uniref:DEK-C domain-containing protein n=1 Tax=Aegilops tauschii subsp. strangulata TaxID=200361 RepID=A0A453DQQ9_AEGTS